jgi:hypothetical protein
VSEAKEEKVQSAKDLLEEHSSPLNSASLFDALLLAGLLEEKKYVSSTGSGEIKSYMSLTDEGQRYGVNRISKYSEKTELRFYPSTFKALLVVASKAILKHSESL